MKFFAKAGADKGLRTSGAQRFNLVGWFSAVSFASILVISVAAAIFLSRFLTQALLERDTEIMAQLINDIVGASQSQDYFASPGGTNSATDIEAFFARMGDMPDVVRANAYTQDRMVIWSTDPTLIGRKYTSNPELEEAFLGHSEFETGQVSRSEKEEHRSLSVPGDIYVENYVPIWNDASARQVVGVVELYRAPEDLLEEIKSGHRFIWSGAASGGLLLFVAQFWLIRRASTVMRRQEQQIVEAETFATMGEMVSAVAHGLRNPLASIRSSAELALESDPPEAKSLLTEIIDQSDRLTNWVRQYLIQTHSGSGDYEDADVEALIQPCLESFQAQLTGQGVACTWHADSDMPLVPVNRVILGQVLNGLVANAVEAMPNGGTLSVTARQSDSAVQIDVTDTGQGMSADELQALMQPFKTTKSGGLGLGLPLAKRLIERHGGKLNFVSQPGLGTTATLILPVT